jgi:hypothetical protein
MISFVSFLSFSIVVSFLEVIDQFLFVFTINAQLELALFGPQNDRLPLHPAHHVERCPRHPPQRHFQHVVGHSRRHRFAQFRRHFKKAVGGAHPADPLVRPFVVVVSDPQPDSFPGRFKAVERRSGQKLLPDRRPKPLHFPQRHRMLRTAFDMGHPVLLQLGLEPARPAPRRILPPVVGEHFLRRMIFAHGNPVNLDHRRRRRTAEQVRPHHVTRVIVEERYEVGVLPSQPEGEDVALPHLIRRRPLEEPGPRQVAPSLGPFMVHQPRFVQPRPDGFRAARQPKHPPQHLRDPLHAPARLRFF